MVDIWIRCRHISTLETLLVEADYFSVILSRKMLTIHVQGLAINIFDAMNKLKTYI